MGDWAVPLVMAAVFICAKLKGAAVFDDFTSGALEGLRVVWRITPTMIAIMLAVSMFSASGALDLISKALAPALSRVGIPAETIPLVLIRPISGSGALAVFKSVIERCGPDSDAGRVASVMQGSTETTFYTIAVYFAATAVKDTRHTLSCSLLADAVGFVLSALTVALLM